MTNVENRVLTEEEKTKLVAMVKDASNLKFQQETINSQIADIRKLAKEEFEVAPKSFNNLLRMYHKDQREKAEEESMGVFDLYDTLFEQKEDSE